MIPNHRQTEEQNQNRTIDQKHEIIDHDQSNRTVSQLSSEEPGSLTPSEQNKLHQICQDHFNTHYTKNLFEEIYESSDLLCKGTQGDVKKCSNKKTDKMFVVKYGFFNKKPMEELKQIIVNLVKVKHPNILQMNELYLDQQKRRYYQVMDYLPYEDLYQQMKRQSSYQIIKPKIKKIMKQLFIGIQCLHQNYLVHRDIKPENILYDPVKEDLKIIDFGLIKKTVKNGKKNNLFSHAGTTSYMAPQMFEEQFDEKVDVWAAGVTLYQLVEGKKPFEGNSKDEKIKNIKQINYKFNEELWSKENNLNLAANLLKHIFVHYNDRLTASEVLNHPFFASFNQAKASRDMFVKSCSVQPIVDIDENGEQISSINYVKMIKKSSNPNQISLQTVPSLRGQEEYQRIKINPINDNNS